MMLDRNALVFGLSALAALLLLSPPLAFAVGSDDTDGDGVKDSMDNCHLVANADQLDVDGDFFGNACDADFNNDDTVDFLDESLFTDLQAAQDLLGDIVVDGVVDQLDFDRMKELFFMPPGPGSLSCDQPVAPNEYPVDALKHTWTFSQDDQGDPIWGITVPPLVTEDRVWVTTWNGWFYGLDRADGSIVWSFDSGLSPGPSDPFGSNAGPTLAPDGSILFAGGSAVVYSLDPDTLTFNWTMSVQEDPLDHVWSNVAVDDARVIVPIASAQDFDACVPGRLVALDLATGVHDWTYRSVPQNVCRNDTTISCMVDTDCPNTANQSCIPAIGAGFTATPSFSPDGSVVYANTVGCLTFPSVGESDSILKIDASTGALIDSFRADPIEQFGTCELDNSIPCGHDGVCAAVSAGVCQDKPVYHDFGFLNGPIRAEVSDGMGGTDTLLVSGSKNGSLYALDESDLSVAWINEVLPNPSPSTAGFGLFNGPLSFDGSRFYAALFGFVPGAGVSEHLQAYDATDGMTVWSDAIGPTWSATNERGGMVFSTNLELGAGNSEMYAHRGATGERVCTFALPGPSVGRVTATESDLFVGMGLQGPGGLLQAFTIAVPEPGVGLLGGVSVALLAGLARRRQGRAAR